MKLIGKITIPLAAIGLGLGLFFGLSSSTTTVPAPAPSASHTLLCDPARPPHSLCYPPEDRP